MIARSLLAASIALIVVTSTAHADGALSKLVNGLKEKSGQDDDGDRRSAREGPRGDDGRTSSDAGNWDDNSGYAGADSDDDPVDYSPPEVYAGAFPGGDADVRIDFGLQRVDDSNGAAYASIRASHDGFGIVLADTAYYEQTRMGTLDLHVWSVGGAYRPGFAPTAVWMSAGLAGATSDGLQLFGAFLGGELSHPLRGALSVDASARLLVYQDDIHGVELRTGIAASILHVGYRMLELNVGPPLRGPELGLTLQF